MPTILPEGIRVPAGSDPYALTEDLRRMMESATTVVPVANDTARGALTTALTAAGRPPSPSDPVYVHRENATPGYELERNAGAGWASVVPKVLALDARKGGVATIASSVMTLSLVIDLPATAPAGRYRVDVLSATLSSDSAAHFIQVEWGAGTVINTVSDDLTVPGNQQARYSWFGFTDHVGGAKSVRLSAQVNGANASIRPQTRMAVQYLGPVA